MQYRLHESCLLSHAQWMECAICQVLHVVTFHVGQGICLVKWSVLICMLLIAEPLEYTTLWIAASFASPLISCAVSLYVDIEVGCYAVWSITQTQT
jgi:hypothetical protein